MAVILRSCTACGGLVGVGWKAFCTTMELPLRYGREVSSSCLVSTQYCGICVTALHRKMGLVLSACNCTLFEYTLNCEL